MTEVLVPEVIKEKEGSQPNFLDIIERLSSNPNVDVEKIQRIIDMQKQIIDREAQQAFNFSMVRAQKNMPVVDKKEKNNQTNSKYAGYDEIVKRCQPIYTAEGFSVTFYQGHGTPDNPLLEGNMRVMADIMHEEGFTKNVYADIPVETTGIKGNANMTKTHATGSAFSYGRSYLLRLIFNIPTGDDDNGNKASGEIKYISDKQKSTLVDMIQSTETDEKKFLKFMDVEDLDKIKEADFNNAMTALRAKVKK
ncbi:MAG: ERF family protein [Clostridia bacterium]|jgi:hypothetical protein